MIVYGFVRYRYPKNCLLILSRLNTSLMLLILSLVSFYLAIDQADLKKELPIVPELIQVGAIFAIVICILIEMIILIPNVLLRLWLFLKGVVSKKSKIRAEGTKKGLIIYDWVLESAIKSKEQEPIAVVDTLDSSPRKRLKSMNKIKPVTTTKGGLKKEGKSLRIKKAKTNVKLEGGEEDKLPTQNKVRDRRNTKKYRKANID